MTNALIWLRRDLRLADNPALQAALEQGLLPVPVYIHDPSLETEGAASRWWLHHSLKALQQDLHSRGSNLLILTGDSLEQLQAMAQSCDASHVFWNRRYEPAAAACDRIIKSRLVDTGLEVESFAGNLLREPWTLAKRDGTPYRVFTPFYRELQAGTPVDLPLPAPHNLPPLPGALPATSGIDDLGPLPEIPWDAAFHEHWQPGEAGAWQRLENFSRDAMADYADNRDRPDLPDTSRLSPHLHFGEISPRQIRQFVEDNIRHREEPGLLAGAEAWLRQLAWREFGHHLLWHYPETAGQPLDRRFESFPWSDDPVGLRAWQTGQTGIPLVDAGMRELWTTGWMHNRVRMVAASLLTKNLLLPWQSGAAWFMDTLVDADLANNTLGWQWTAGCGADAAPYFRVFNPVRQGERFDPDGVYVRRWVPELAGLPARWIHQPWAAPASQLHDAGIMIGKDYPQPIVDLSDSRKAALSAWDRIRQRPGDVTKQ
jgi:deoxyribodipyrimidine photo-lyase